MSLNAAQRLAEARDQRRATHIINTVQAIHTALTDARDHGYLTAAIRDPFVARANTLHDELLAIGRRHAERQQQPAAQAQPAEPHTN